MVTVDSLSGLTREIGSVGFTVNGLEYVSSTGKLYGTTSEHDPSAANSLIEIDVQTGAGTLIGTGQAALQIR